MDQVVQTWWPVIVGFVVVVAWAIRLEAKVYYTEKALNDHKAATAVKDTESNRAIWEKFETLQTLMMTVSNNIARLEGVMQATKKND